MNTLSSFSGKSEKQAQPIADAQEQPVAASVVYNLIILDESGSMHCVRNQTIEGCNETLNTIRKTAAEDAETAQFMSIFCFDTNLNFNRYIVENIFIDTVKNLTMENYRPNRGTPSRQCGSSSVVLGM